MLDFLTSTNVGRRVPDEEEDTVSEVSEAELREVGEQPGAGGESPLFLPTPSFMASAEKE